MDITASADLGTGPRRRHTNTEKTASLLPDTPCECKRSMRAAGATRLTRYSTTGNESLGTFGYRYLRATRHFKDLPLTHGINPIKAMLDGKKLASAWDGDGALVINIIPILRFPGFPGPLRRSDFPPMMDWPIISPRCSTKRLGGMYFPQHGSHPRMGGRTPGLQPTAQQSHPTNARRRRKKDVVPPVPLPRSRGGTRSDSGW